MAQAPLRTVGRVVDILELFDETSPTRTLRDLMDETELPRSTVLRLTADLVARGVLSLDARGQYSIGAAMLRWTTLAQTMWRVDEATHDVLRGLVRDLGETASLYVRQNLHRTPIASVEGRHGVRNVVELGLPMPLTGGASAIALLSGDPTLIDKLAEEDPTLDADALRARASRAAEDGFATSAGEREVGAASVAVPVRNHEGRVVAALSVSGPESRFNDAARERARVSLTAAADHLSTTGIGPVGGLL